MTERLKAVTYSEEAETKESKKYGNRPIVKKNISSVHLRTEDELIEYYNNCGLSPALSFESAKEFDYRKITYSIGDIDLCTTQSKSGWGFEKQISTDVYFVSFTYAGLSAWEMNKLGRVDALNQMCVIDSSRLVQGQFLRGTLTDTLMIKAETIHNEFHALHGYPVNHRIDFQPLLPAESPAWKRINHIAGCLKSSFDDTFSMMSPITNSYIKQALLTSILEFTPHNQSIKSNECSNLPRYISRSIEYMYTHADQPILLADIASNSYTSIRNLQIGFRKYKGTTPMRYLRQIRLNRVHNELSNMSSLASWQCVAAKWGFNDTAALSKYYKELYGETPFQTLYRNS
ncbi:helix-turn-helix transcriptional regulator [Pseudomonas sp. AK106]